VPYTFQQITCVKCRETSSEVVGSQTTPNSPLVLCKHQSRANIEAEELA